MIPKPGLVAGEKTVKDRRYPNTGEMGFWFKGVPGDRAWPAQMVEPPLLNCVRRAQFSSGVATEEPWRFCDGRCVRHESVKQAGLAAKRLEELSNGAQY